MPSAGVAARALGRVAIANRETNRVLTTVSLSRRSIAERDSLRSGVSGFHPTV
jgi:hypothetical protein